MSPSRVLIIDDESNIRETMRLALEAVGHTAETAADGPAGLERFGSGAEWDLVLLDQRMPGMDGIEVLRRIREIKPDAEVIMVTAFATVDLAVDAMKAGAMDFLRKPFTPDVLRRAVAAAIDRSSIPSVPPTQPAVTSPLPPGAGFRSLDGFRFWPAPDVASSGITVSGALRRAFVVASPRGHTERCTLVLSGRAVEAVLRLAGESNVPAGRVSDAAAWAVLMGRLWEHREMPPDSIEVTDLTPQHIEVLKGLLKSSPEVLGRRG
jgi:DNA-binding response OmpR family regulator